MAIPSLLMRSDGECMVVSMKDTAKLFGISVIVCCAVLVCSMFTNYYIDITGIEDQIITEQALFFYNAQVSTAKVVCFVSGGCLLATSIVMLFFYIKHYIDTHKESLGILKALGYSNVKIARNFWVFGISVLIGAVVGLGGATIFMPSFYELQNKEQYLPEIGVGFHPVIPFFFVMLPTVAFSLLAVGYACIKLKQPPLALLKDDILSPGKQKRQKKQLVPERSFLEEVRSNVVRTKKTLSFFIFFASFCFSAMTQMSFSMKDLSSEMMGVMILVIGLILSFVTLYLAITTVVHGNTKTIAMMKAFGYTEKECTGSILGCYRPLAAIGFIIGTAYQYGLLRLMVDIVFRDIPGVPEYKFDVPMMCLSLAVFIIVYEFVMAGCTRKIKEISIKEIMLE